ncbi:MAG: hypothetical protein M1823_005480 [Watsoniomyces obsoletus]|nr:MAG: hypothetical protein M1823_005480 [Watsoniomyces obsoletus]
MSSPEGTSPPRRFLPTTSDFFSPRSRRQLSIFVAGATFLFISTAITRRSLYRRYKATLPAFYHFNNRPTIPISGASEALEALNIATINVFSVSLMVTGGMMWAYDISSLEDLRRKVRAGMGVRGTEQDADEEIEEWMASVLSRKDDREKRRRREEEDGGDP